MLTARIGNFTGGHEGFLSTWYLDPPAYRPSATASPGELGDYKVHAAVTFATKEGVSAAVGRIESAVDRLTGRIDRLLEAQANAPQPSRRSGA